MSEVAELVSQSAVSQCLMIRAGRGNSGGTTALNATIELGLSEGRHPIMLDAARNPSLSALYKTCARPHSHAIADVKEAIHTHCLDAMMDGGQSGVVDLGGGQDDTLAEFLLDLDLVAYCRTSGIEPVFLVTFGPQMDDFDHVLEIKRRGIFDGANVLLVQSEGVLKKNQDPTSGFGAIISRPEYAEWVGKDGAKPLYLPTLACLPQIRELGLSLNEAAGNAKKLGHSRAWMTRNWLKSWRDQFIANKCDGWRV